MVDCLLIIVAFRSAGDLAVLIESVPEAAGALSWHAIVVNNAPGDDLSGVISAHEQVTLVEAGANLGYSGGLNLGLRNAPASRVIAILNPDLVLAPHSLEVLAQAVSDESVGVAVPIILDPDDAVRPSLRREPTILRALGEALFGDHWAGRPDWLSEMVRDPRDYRGAHPVDWATGAALVMRAEVAEQTGDWDSGRFFLYSEETDYCRRVRQQGRQIRFTPDAVVRHRESGSGSSARLDALLEVNKVSYYRKWHSGPAAAVFAAVSMLHNLLRAGRPGARAALAAQVSPRVRRALPGGAR